MLIKLEQLGYRTVKNYDDMLSRCYLIADTGTSRTDRQTDGRTDGPTDRQNCYINIARQYADAR